MAQARQLVKRPRIGEQKQSKSLTRARRLWTDIFGSRAVIFRLSDDVLLYMLSFLSSTDQLRLQYTLVTYAPGEMIRQERMQILHSLYTLMVVRDFSRRELETIPAATIGRYLFQGLDKTKVLRLGTLHTTRPADWSVMMQRMPLRVLRMVQPDAEFPLALIHFGTPSRWLP